MNQSSRFSSSGGSLCRAVLLLLLMAPPLVAALDLNETDSLSESQTGAEDEFDVHVYVNNQDDDRLEIMLFIDSELMDAADVSSESETKLGEYALTPGEHSFKITWRDEDTKKNYEEEVVQVINASTSSILYTTRNDAPEKFDISVKVENENDRSLDAYLYVDGNLEMSKEVLKESTADFGEISMEEGVHDLCLRWRDPETKIEYEKRKMVNVEGDDAVVFYAPKGVSFESEEETWSSSSSDVKASSFDDTSSSFYETKAEEETENASIQNTTPSEDVSSTSSEKIDVSKAMTMETKFLEAEDDEHEDSEAEDNGADDRKTSTDGSHAMSSGCLYLYAAVVLLAIYLVFRH